MNQIFLGEPAQEIKNWFVQNFPYWPKETTLTFTEASGKPLELKLIEGEATWKNIGVKSNPSNTDSTLKSIKFGNLVKSLGNGALSDCYALRNVELPSSVTSIEDYAFYGCSSLTSINIPNSVTSIEYNAFQGCTSLSSITIPNSVKSIGSDAFSGCSSLTSINIPNSVTSIKRDAFYGCKSLTSIVFEGKTMSQITSMSYYPWSANTSVIVPGIK